MIDKRPFYSLLYNMKMFSNEDRTLIESIEEKYSEIEPITDKEKRALALHPMQFVERIKEDNGEWTTQLHIWAENGVKEILNLDPMFLSFKNSYGDSVLMCLAIGATGTHTDKIDYQLITDILSKDFTYEDHTTDINGNDEIITRNALNETDINGKTPIDYISDIAYAKGDYQNDEPDMHLIHILSTMTKSKQAENGSEPMPELT